MTYRELLKDLRCIPERHLDDSAKVYDPYEKEYISIVNTHMVKHGDQHPTKARFLLDDGEVYMVLKA